MEDFILMENNNIDIKIKILELLKNDETVKQAIIDIIDVKAENKKNISTPKEEAENVKIDDKEVTNDKEAEENNQDDIVKKLQDRINEKDQQINELKQYVNNLKDEKRLIQQDNQSLNKTLSKERTDYKELKDDYVNLQQRYNDKEQETSHLKGKLHHSDVDKGKLEQRIMTLSSEKLKLQQKIEKQNILIEDKDYLLSQRFPQGWRMFSDYKKLSENTLHLLKAVFKQNNFTSFICSGAQEDSLKKIWDIIKHCLSENNSDDVMKLWNIFNYCIELVNSSKAEKTYEILQVNVGESFDFSVHNLVDGSRAHGKIKEINLPGFKNINSGQVERKSIVNV